jgi:hypothetical protein
MLLFARSNKLGHLKSARKPICGEPVMPIPQSIAELYPAPRKTGLLPNHDYLHVDEIDNALVNDMKE